MHVNNWHSSAQAFIHTCTLLQVILVHRVRSQDSYWNQPVPPPKPRDTLNVLAIWYLYRYVTYHISMGLGKFGLGGGGTTARQALESIKTMTEGKGYSLLCRNISITVMLFSCSYIQSYVLTNTKWNNLALGLLICLSACLSACLVPTDRKDKKGWGRVAQ